MNKKLVTISNILLVNSEQKNWPMVKIYFENWIVIRMRLWKSIFTAWFREMKKYLKNKIIIDRKYCVNIIWVWNAYDVIIWHCFCCSKTKIMNTNCSIVKHQKYTVNSFHLFYCLWYRFIWRFFSLPQEVYKIYKIFFPESGRFNKELTIDVVKMCKVVFIASLLHTAQ
jgi:hypothetical protein